MEDCEHCEDKETCHQELEDKMNALIDMVDAGARRITSNMTEDGSDQLYMQVAGTTSYMIDGALQTEIADDLEMIKTDQGVMPVAALLTEMPETLYLVASILFSMGVGYAHKLSVPTSERLN
jgi:hypothetical protein